MPNHDAGHPHFDGGVTITDGAVTGCWLLDGLGLLGERGALPHAASWTTTVERAGSTVRVTTADGPQGAPPADWSPERPTRLPSGDVGQMRRFLGRVAMIDAVLADPRSPQGEEFARRLAWTEHQAGSRVAPALDGVTASLRSARAAVAPFLATLDPDAVRLAAHPSLGTSRGELHAQLDRTFDLGAPLAQAMTWHPLWVAEWREMALREPDALSSAVARGPEAVRSAAFAFVARRLSQATARGAERVDAVVAGMTEGERTSFLDAVRSAAGGPSPMIDVGYVVARLPPSWIPRDVPGWLAYASCHLAAMFAVSRADPEGGAMLGAGGDWLGLHARLTAAHGQGPDGLRAGLADLLDHHRSYASQVLLPAMLLHGHEDTADLRLMRGGVRGPSRVVRWAETLLSSGRGVRRMLEASRRWHADAARIRAAMPASTAMPDRWPRAWPTAVVHGVRVAEVTDREGLDAEGMRGADGHGDHGLAHCVGGYAAACLEGRSRVLSLRDAVDGTRLSTAEVCHDATGPHVAQHRGHRNATPPTRCMAALAAYVGDVADGRLNLDEAALAAVASSRPALTAAGYDFEAVGAWEAVRDAWDPHVPRHLRGVRSGDLARMMEGLASRKGPIWCPSPYRSPPAARAHDHDDHAGPHP